MAFQRNGYYYDQQIRNYTLQFMAIFSGLQVQVGKWNESDESLISVPVHYGDPDRVVAAILANNTQNSPVRLPVMSAYMKGMNIAPERMHGVGVERRNSYVPVGGLLPDDIKVVYQRNPVPYNMEMELAIMTSNTDQMWQIIEQIMVIFDPQLTIQTSDSIFDMSRLTSVELKSGPSYENPYPSGQERRYVKAVMTFEMPIYLSIPADVKKNYIERIFMRIGAVSTGASSSEEIISELDAQGIPYRLVLSEDDLPIT